MLLRFDLLSRGVRPQKLPLGYDGRSFFSDTMKETFFSGTMEETSAKSSNAPCGAAGAAVTSDADEPLRIVPASGVHGEGHESCRGTIRGWSHYEVRLVKEII